jgi:hypothetical protein
MAHATASTRCGVSDDTTVLARRGSVDREGVSVGIGDQ